MASTRRFDVFVEVPASSLPFGALRAAITARWVCRWKGDVARFRLVCRSFSEDVKDEDQTYASTPLRAMVRLLAPLSLSLNWRIEFWDVGAAFLHAAVTGELYVVPPHELYDQGSVLWKLKKALCRLRMVPRAWQDHLAELLHTHHFNRTRSEATVYVNSALKVTIIIVHVDGLVVCGNKQAITDIMSTLSKSLLLNRTGDLATDGVSAVFTGRHSAM